MKGLTEAQRDGLAIISANPHRTGEALRLTFGLSYSTIAALSRAGFIDAEWHVYLLARIPDRRWDITEAGRDAIRALEKQK